MYLSFMNLKLYIYAETIPSSKISYRREGREIDAVWVIKW